MRTRALLVAVGLLAATLTGPRATAATLGGRRASDATRDFKSRRRRRRRRGYGEFAEAAGLTCIEHHHDGGMGVHYVHGKRVGRRQGPLAQARGARLRAATSNGKLRLVAVEYIVFKSAWRETHPTGKPRLHGQRFTLEPAGNRYGIPAFYELHLWAWKDNPAGLYADYNPDVTCPAA